MRRPSAPGYHEPSAERSTRTVLAAPLLLALDASAADASPALAFVPAFEDDAGRAEDVVLAVNDTGDLAQRRALLLLAEAPGSDAAARLHLTLADPSHDDLHVCRGPSQAPRSRREALHPASLSSCVDRLRRSEKKVRGGGGC